jgi:hypothetical protein
MNVQDLGERDKAEKPKVVAPGEGGRKRVGQGPRRPGRKAAARLAGRQKVFDDISAGEMIKLKSSGLLPHRPGSLRIK